jgi:putative phage-type endonuclease
MDIITKLSNCKVYSRDIRELNEEAWLKARTKGIGGSDIGAICGVSSFSTARRVYLDKTGQFDESVNVITDAAKERMHFGHLLEPVVAFEFNRKTGIPLCELNAILVHKDYPWAFANVDRVMLDTDGNPIGILECKTTTEFLNDDWKEGDIPLSYVYQLQWYLWITGMEQGAFACLVGGNKFYDYTIYRNDELLNDVIIPAAKSFWFDNVLKLQEPPLQANDTEFANSIYSTVIKNSEITLNDDVSNELADTVFNCKIQIKELTTTMEEAQNRIKELLKENEIGYTKDYTIKWSPRAQIRVDTDRLKGQYPEIYSDCQKKVEFRVMSVTGVKYE